MFCAVRSGPSTSERNEVCSLEALDTTFGLEALCAAPGAAGAVFGAGGPPEPGGEGPPDFPRGADL